MRYLNSDRGWNKWWSYTTESFFFQNDWFPSLGRVDEKDVMLMSPERAIAEDHFRQAINYACSKACGLCNERRACTEKTNVTTSERDVEHYALLKHY